MSRITPNRRTKISPTRYGIIVGTLIASLTVAATQTPSSTFRYSDAKGDLTISAKSGRAERSGTAAYKMTLTGSVQIVSKGQGTNLSADRVITVAGGSGSIQIQSAVATGKVKILKNTTRQVTEITSMKADLKASQSGDRITLTGPVTIRNVDNAKRQTLLATGSAGSAVLEPSSGIKSNALREATLSGPVRINVREVPQGGTASTIVATGSKMTLRGQTLTIEGKVEIKGEGANSLGSFSNLSRATFRLNAANEVTSFETEAGR